MKKRSKGTRKGRYWPSFDSAFLAEVTDSLRKRSKAIKHRVRSYSCDKVREKEDDAVYEKAELYFELYGERPFRVSCHLWDDRWVWIDVRQSAKAGWAFEWQHAGRVGAVPPTEIAETIWQMLTLPRIDGVEFLASGLDELWIGIAISGPTGTV